MFLNFSHQMASVPQLGILAMLLMTVQVVAGDELATTESVDTVVAHVLQLPVCRDPKVRFRDSASDVRFVAIVFHDGIASIARVTSIGRVQHCLASTNSVGPGIDKRSTYGKLLPPEKLAVLTAVLKRPPKESRSTELKHILILRIRNEEEFVDKFYDRTTLPPELREFERLAVPDASKGAFGVHAPREKGKPSY